MTGTQARLALLVLSATALVAGLAGGLARLGVVASMPAAAFHGALMTCGFLGCVIALERAVALGSPLAYAAPLAAGLGTVALLSGWHALAAALWIAAPAGLFAASVAIVRRQLEAHTVLLAVASLAWLAGSVAHAAGRFDAAPAWWFAFLVLTIAAERLEMSRLVRRPAWAARLLVGMVAVMLAACVLATLDERAGRVLYGASFLALASWLAVFDIARRTVRTEGFARYAAVALLAGYFWLAVAGVAWALAPAARDVALHALGVGFVFSMILAHAPVIVPVVARVRMRYVPFFYLPLALLHASLALRLAGGAADPALRAAGAIGNSVAVAAFIGTLAYAIATRERAATR